MDLHWRLIDNPRILRDVDLGSAVQWVAVGPGQVRTLSDQPLFAYLCVHGGVHNWARLKWLADLNAWLQRLSAAEVGRLYAAAVGYGAGRAARFGLHLCHELLGLHLPREVQLAIQADKIARRLAANAVAGMTSTDDSGRWSVQRLRATIGPLFLGGWATFGHQLRVSVVHPGERARLRLPNRLSFLYYLLRAPLWTMSRLRAIAARRAA